MSGLVEHSVTATVETRYLDFTPDSIDPRAVIFALHGYGMNAEVMLHLAGLWFPRLRIVSIEAPHPFYKTLDTQEVGYTWAAHTRSLPSVRLHHQIVRAVFSATGVPVERRVLLGFSQPVGLNYRFAATHPDDVSGVIGVCGGLSKDWEINSYQTVSASLLHIARDSDEAYPIQAAREFPRRLRLRAADVEYLEYPGAHRFPSSAGPDVNAWLEHRFRVVA